MLLYYSCVIFYYCKTILNSILLKSSNSGGLNTAVIGRSGMDAGNLDMPPYSSSIYHSPPLSANTTPRRALELENLSIAQLSSLAPVSICYVITADYFIVRISKAA